MKNFIKEFKEFISKGNVLDMAVGIIIGSAFTGIVTSLVDDIINPLLGIFGGANLDQLSIALSGEASLNYGNFISSIINFLIMALVVFLIVKSFNKVSGKINPKKPAAPTTKECPFCKSTIAIGATKCPHCTSDITE